ncbi:glucose-1-phosphate thymidylyltransferase [Candidatus Thorarchaeota archaeon]|nr:MAG: glucose-1-phosphate thymidylyltransferase [Candidatus Thorarchaeota archaeon]
MKKAAILAAGDSTRMRPLSSNRPKHLLPIAGKPLLFHTLDALKDAGMEEVLVVYGYEGQALRDAIDARDWGQMRISYIRQDKRMGTAHAAGHAQKFAEDDHILLMYGDVLVGPETYTKLIDQHKQTNANLTLTVYPVEDPAAYGVVSVEGKKVKDLIEKPREDQMVSNLVNAGIYAVGPELWEAIAKTKKSDRGEYEITDSIMMLVHMGKVGAFTIENWWIDVGKPWDLLEANEIIMKNALRAVAGKLEDGVTIKGDVVVDPSAHIKSGAYIEGPVYIGPECVVGPNCYIRAYTALVARVKIGNAVEIKNSIIMENTNIGHLSYVGDSIIGRNSNFGAGTITANLRHDDQTVRVAVKEERVDSGRRKLGAIIADDVKTGIGTSIAPGVVMATGARTGVGTIVERDVPENVLVRPKQKTETVHLNPKD